MNNGSLERTVLGACLLSDQYRDLVLDQVGPSDFFSRSSRRILKAMKGVRDRGVALDLVTLKQELYQAGELDAVGGPAGLADMLSEVHRSANLPSYIQLLKAEATRRRLAAEAQGLVAAVEGNESQARLREHVEALGEVVADGAGILEAEDLGDVLARPAPDTPWAIDDILAEGDVAIISGPGGVGKSWLLLSVALSLSTGRSLFGRYKLKRSYKVAIVDLESRPWESDQRLHRIAAGLELQPEEILGSVKVVRRRVRLDRQEDLGQLMASLKTWGTEFVLLDSFRRVIRGDENSSGVVSDLFCSALDRIRSELGCGVILTDHTRKLTGERELDAAGEALRGSTDKRNLTDAHIGVEAREERIAWIPTKTRHGKLPEPLLLELQGLEDGQDGPVKVIYIGTVDKASDKVQDALTALLVDAPESSLFRGEILGRCRYSERAVDQALTAMKNRGKVERRKDGKQVRYTLRPQRPHSTALGFEAP